VQKLEKFILFDSAAEFTAWLETAKVTRTIRLVQNHHTYKPDYSNFKGDNYLSMLKGMEAWHLQSGFAEIAQNLTTFPDGKIAVCRALDTIPAGIKGANTGGICIEHVGNFDAGGDAMRDAHRQAIIDLNAALCRRFHLTPSTDTIVYHHWWDLVTGARTNGTGVTKTCPGSAFFGGNSVQNAQQNFIPLVAAALGKVKKPPKGGTLYRVSASSLNVRSAPSSTATKVSSLRNGVEVSVYEQKDGWGRVDAKNSLWVSMQFLEAVG